MALNARRTVDFALPTLCDVTLEVVDQDGAVVPDFDVKARPESEGMSTSRTEQEGTTDADGLVSFALPCGPRWMVNFEGPGAQMAFGLGEPPDAPFELVVDTSRRGEEIWLRLESAADGEALHGWFRQQPGVPRPAHRIPREGVLLGPLDPDVTYIVATNRHEPTSFAPADLAPVPDDDGRRWATLVLTPHGEIEVIAEPSASDRIETVTCVEPAGASHGCRRLTGQPRWTCRCSDEGGFAMKVRIMDVDVLQPVVRPETRLQPIPPAAELCLEAGTCGGAADDVVLISLPDHPWGGGCGSRTDAVDSRCLRVPRGERLHIACWAVGEMVAWETEIVAGEERNVVLGD
ncbi:MAG: DUF4198 domain-containing protein [Proteobacteria bacterium]|nr:DUF4198 domain-containing protein [Pseudomonadota bacterium]